MTDAELEGFRSDRYLARSWALLTRDRGWIKPVLAMTAAMFVPVVGMLGVTGYVLEWARLTAWGVTSAPKQRGVRVGACIASGARVFVVTLVWGTCKGLIGGLLGVVPLFGSLLSFAWSVFGVYLIVVTMVAELRTVVYQRIRAGLRLRAVRSMASHDVGGLMRVLGILVAGMAVTAAVGTAISIGTLVSLLPELLSYYDYFLKYGQILSEAMVIEFSVRMVVSLITSMGPGLVILGVVSTFLSVICSLLTYTALALWIRQFDVPAWGREEDPVPGTAPAPSSVAGPSGYVAPGQPGPYAAPGQPGPYAAPGQPGSAASPTAAPSWPSPAPAAPTVPPQAPAPSEPVTPPADDPNSGPIASD